MINIKKINLRRLIEMPLCLDRYYENKTYLTNIDTLIVRKICSVYMVGDGESILSGGPEVVSFAIAQKKPESVKFAYVKLGSVGLGWFTTSAKEGIFIENKLMDEGFCWEPIKWDPDWKNLEKIVKKDIWKAVKDNFGFDVLQYLHNNRKPNTIDCISHYG
jgi:hypothetical protein